ncbi:MAG TPA: ROK family transcriptional regulator [Clostridiaceae bacterium]|nr:ROK family transcriptional regulator [Clostridiaceae bacterium]
MKAAKPELMSKLNKDAILYLLRNEGPLSRADIARKLNMSFPAVSSNVKSLLESGFIVKIGEGEGSSGLGRKSTLFAFNAKRGYVIGIDAGRSQIRALCSDLLGEPVASVKKDNDFEKGGEYLYQQIESALLEVIEKSNISKENIECICIGLPGIRDEDKKINRLAPFIDNWENIDVAERIREKINSEIIIDNGVNLGAIGEKWKGAAQGYQNIVYINLGVGIGAGIIINNELYRGKNNAAGEIGYMTLDKHFLRKRYKEEGSMEELISVPSLNNTMKFLTKRTQDFSMEEIIKLAESDNLIAKGVIYESLVYLSMAITNIVAVLNPELIVIAGRAGKVLAEKYGDLIIKYISANVPFVPDFVVSKLGDDASVIGAVGVAIRHTKNNYKSYI